MRVLNTHAPSTASPFGRINLEPSQATASKHRSPHSIRVRVRVRVRVGWSASGATAKKKNNVYYVPGTRYFGTTSSINISSISSSFHRMCISNSRTRVRIYYGGGTYILYVQTADDHNTYTAVHIVQYIAPGRAYKQLRGRAGGMGRLA